MKYVVRMLFLVCLFFGGWCFSASATSFGSPQDNVLYAELLQKYVVDGLVDYSGLQEEEGKLDQYLSLLAGVAVSQLNLKEQLAYYINAYNAWTWKLVLQHYPQITSIKDIGSFWSSPWKKKFVHMEGKTVSLDYIEHDVLRPVFHDPRIHAALNCASMSCPPLRNEPYDFRYIDEQLDDDAKQWINTPQYNKMSESTLYLSKIFDWFEDDFGGEEGVLRFVRRFADENLLHRLNAHKNNVRLRYLDYDWSLNSASVQP